MMSSANPEHVRLERPVEIYENERMWIGRGFSKAGLLPAERGPYSTGDGSVSWKSMPEASLALLRGDVSRGKSGGGENGDDGRQGLGSGNGNGSPATSPRARTARRGWSFREPDIENESNHSSNHIYDSGMERENSGRMGGGQEHECIESGFIDDAEYCGFEPTMDGPCDEDGWQYYPDFTAQSLASPNYKRGMLDFVRRRKLRRIAIFRPDHFLPREVYTKCDFCDSNIVNMLSNAMLDALSLATLFAFGLKDDVTDAQALSLKSKLIDTLCIGENCSNENHDPWVDIHKVKDRLCEFAGTCAGKPGPLMHLFDPNRDNNLVNALPERCKVVERYFNERERASLARLVIKDADRYSYKMHCNRSSCACVSKASNGSSEHDNDELEDACEFRLVPCPNVPCKATFSFKHAAQHEEDCEWKRMPCPSGCGMQIARRDVHAHVRDDCSLRRAECPLSVVGCTAVVQAKDISSHLRDDADKHFILVANRMLEYQNVFKGFNARIKSLEENNARLERELQRATSQLQSKSDARTVTNDVKKLTKRLGALESSCRVEFKQAEKERRNRK